MKHSVVGNSGRLDFLGYPMSQNEYALEAFDMLFKTVKPARVIELGALNGGLTTFLGLYSLTAGCSVISYDIANSLFDKSVLDKLGVDMRFKDIFASDTLKEISDMIRQDGITVLLCDNGNKIGEFNHFSQFLKVGDIIMAHDYAPDMTFFNKEMRGKVWPCCEITENHIEECSRRYLLRPLLADPFLQAAWVCKVKVA